ncbi:hypothetical protein ACC848_45585, partial [Rhizobium johnstonii]
VQSLLDWRPQAEAYVGVYDVLTGHYRNCPAVPVTEEVRSYDAEGRAYVDLLDDEAFEEYLLRRGAAPATIMFPTEG